MSELARELTIEEDMLLSSDGYNPFLRVCHNCKSKTYSPVTIGKRTCNYCLSSI